MWTRVGKILGTHDVQWASWQVIERGPVRWSFRSEGEVGGCSASLEARLYRGERRVEMRVTVDWDGRDGFLASHIPNTGEMVGDMPFCVEDKRLDEEPYVGIERRREGMFIARSFVDTGSLAYVSHDGDRYFIRDADAGMLAHILVNSVRSFYAEWEESVNREMRGEGRHEFTFSIVPHEGDWRQAGLWRLSESLRNPARTAWPLPGGDLPTKRSLISVEPANVQMSACYLDGGRLLVRVFETHGIETEATIEFPFEPDAAVRVDLNANELGGEGVSIAGANVSVKLRTFEIATIAVPLR